VKQSQARHREVGFFTATPEGFGDGSGLPVCLVLHGASATTADYERFGFAQFLTAAVRAGVPPFVLAGADGGRTRWAGDGAADDPQRMLIDEIPAWCSDHGFDTSRLAAYGWSMGGYGVLLAAIRNPGLFRAVAALSPAVGGDSDEVVSRAGELDPARTAVFCGTADSLYDSVRAMAARIPGGPAIESYEPGAHTRGYWNRITPEAFAFIGRALAG
jgi:enterochelin esterase-like enzyme